MRLAANITNRMCNLKEIAEFRTTLHLVNQKYTQNIQAELKKKQS